MTDSLKWLQALDPLIEPLPINDLGPGKVRMLVAHSNWMHYWDSLVMCHFLPYSPAQMTDMTNAVTGWENDLATYLRVGERAATLARLYNLREGWDAAGDTLPKRFFESFESGPLAGVGLPREDFDGARIEYYHQMGWDDEGVPMPGRLAELGIDKLE
jgi:aldehyde:ferredoxin oxidoreductase